MFDTRLPFGACRGCSIFHRLSQAVKRMMIRRGYLDIVVYLDDFLVIADTYVKCCEAQQVLIQLLGSLGFFVSWHKVYGPSTKLTFLGIEIDTMNCCLRLDDEKLKKINNKLCEFQYKVRATKRQLQSLAGLLNWACQAVRGGRFFLRRVLDMVNLLKSGNHKAKLGYAFKSDITWWRRYMIKCNGVVYYHAFDTNIVVHTDACNVGGGAFSQGDWFYRNWSVDIPQASNLHINYKEVLAVTQAVEQWCHRWTNANVVIMTDNTVTKAVINKGTCKSPLVMKHLRRLFWEMELYNFKLHAVHIPGCINFLPDAISRLHEKGQFEHLCGFLQNWYHGYFPLNLLSHMSRGAFQMLQRQGVRM